MEWANQECDGQKENSRAGERTAKGDALQKLKTEKKEKAMTRSTGKLQRIGQLNMLFSWVSIV
jgi:hypothetical protein